MDFDAIIIGGGLGGLSAGAILSRHGKKVMLLEQHYVPGGCATTFKRKDFLMEAGLHAMDGHHVVEQKTHSILRYLGVKKHIEFLPLPEFFQFKNAHINFTFPSGAKKAKEALIKEFPGEEKAIKRFFKLILGVQEELSRLPRKKGEKLLKYALFPFFFPRLTFTFRRTLGHYLDRHFKSEDLKLILQGNLLYYHDDPYTMSLAFFAKAQAGFIEKGGYFIKGGSQNLSDSLARVIEQNNGILLLGKRVEKILVEKGKATGVSFCDAFNKQLKPETFFADHIIHAGAVPLLPELLGGTAGKKIKKRISGMHPSTSLFCIYIGFSKELKSLGERPYSTFFYGDDVKRLKDAHSNYQGPWEQRMFAFVDYSQIDSGLTPKGKSFAAICVADRLSDWEGLDEDAYKSKKAEVAGIILDRLEKAIPGVKDLIDYYEVATSKTIKKYTLNPSAAPYGFAQTPVQAGFKRPSYKSPVNSLWLAGTWTFPGGGFTGAIVSGFLCGIKLRNVLDKENPVRKKGHYSDSRIVNFLDKREIATQTLELSFQKPAGFHFQVGQYAYVKLLNPAHEELDIPIRPLSIASHPDEENLRFVMRKSESAYKRSCTLLNQENSATIYGPVGDFFLNPDSGGMVFLASGIGISPVLPMLRELEKQQYKNPVYLFYSNKNLESAAYHNKLEKSEIANYTYVPVFTESEQRINREKLKKIIPDLMKLDYYIVGSSGFLDSMTEVLQENGVKSAQIFKDDFG